MTTGSEFWSSTLVKRRKAHSCETCGRVVNKGEESWNEAGVADGDFNWYKMCSPCKELTNLLWKEKAFEDGFYYLYELPEYARDYGIKWPPESGLVPA